MLLKLLLYIFRFIYLRDLLNNAFIIFAINLLFKLILQISLQFEINFEALLVLFK